MLRPTVNKQQGTVLYPSLAANSPRRIEVKVAKSILYQHNDRSRDPILNVYPGLQEKAMTSWEVLRASELLRQIVSSLMSINSPPV